MKAISTRITKGVQVGSSLKCIDNTGAKVLRIIAIKGFRGVKGRNPNAGIGAIVICTVKKGDQKIKHEIVKAIIVRQKMEYRRPMGIRIKFNDNAGILIDDKFEPRGREIKGIIAKEVVERFPVIGKIASSII